MTGFPHPPEGILADLDAGDRGGARASRRDPAAPGTGLAALRRLRDQLRPRLRRFNTDEELLDLSAEIVGWQQGLDAVRLESLYLLLVCMWIQVEQGSTRFPLAGPGPLPLDVILPPLLDGLPEGLLHGYEDPLTTRALLEGEIEAGTFDRLVGGPGSARPLILQDRDLWFHRHWHFERRFADRLAGMLARPPTAVEAGRLEDALADVLARPPVIEGRARTPSPRQQDAVRLALGNDVTIITGGPGTGKTSVTASILRCLVRLGVGPEAIARAAPTGKAAYRMGEAIRQTLDRVIEPGEADGLLAGLPEPTTLHRLLGYVPGSGTFRHHAGNPLSHRVVVVDESSMVDLALMDQLLASLDRGCRLILLGDSDQLPSVAAGAVFRDLVGSSPSRPSLIDRGHGIALQESYRMDARDPAGANILGVARRIREGQDAGLVGPAGGPHERIQPRPDVTSILHRGCELLTHDDPGLPGELLDRWNRDHVESHPDYQEWIRRDYPIGEEGFSRIELEVLTALFDHLERSRILCFTRVLDRGTNQVNAHHHRRALERLPGQRAAGFVPGDPVLMLHNDPTRDLFNGDVGVILRVVGPSGQRAPMAVFRRGPGFAAHALFALRSHLELAYALTIHKAQGSEYDHVALLLPPEDLPLNTRELLYTGLTRSRISVTLVGRESILRAGVRRGLRRHSGVADALEEALASRGGA